jgi:hypothetical protein
MEGALKVWNTGQTPQELEAATYTPVGRAGRPEEARFLVVDGGNTTQETNKA